VAPVVVLLLVIALDLAAPPGLLVLDLVVIAPMAAAILLSPRATAAYGVAALACAALLGIYDQQYTADVVGIQITRLVLIALGGAVAVAACSVRRHRERLASRLSAAQAADRAVLRLAETLQRSMLTDPPQLPRVATAVRYLPAARGAQIGGDWYDAFTVPDGRTMVVIGDVAGHDASAAAVMAQARGLLRGLAQSVVGSPAAVLRALDRALMDLGMHTLVTLTVATLDEQVDGAGVELCWSNAGHPPPALVSAAGTASVLDRRPDRLLGVGLECPRADHRLRLAPGDTLLLYTDGLVERRDVPLDAGLAELVERLQRSSGLPLEELCDDLVNTLGGRTGDDVAVFALRVRQLLGPGE
jgi:serine phosphatase RsbU (regulator of sigma subunit)